MFFCASRRRRAVLNSVCKKAGSYCGVLVRRRFVSTRSQRSVALPVRVQRYERDAVAPLDAKTKKKLSASVPVKTLAIKQQSPQA